MILEDTQSGPAEKPIAIDHVGVTDLRYPVVVLDRQNKKQQTVAKFKVSVGLPHHFKGTHMSRFIEALDEHRGEITMRNLLSLLRDLRERLDAESARVIVRFPYFLQRNAPVTGAGALMDYDCEFIAESNGKSIDLVVGVEVPVATLCPCSKAIADYGAHNQRGYISIKVRTTRCRQSGEMQFVWIEELIEVAERSGSAPLYPLLKRPDERFLTMAVFENPVFVEDMVRNVAAELQADDRIAWFFVHAENHESIHNHNAFAELVWTRPTE